MGTIHVEHDSGDRFTSRVRDHIVVTDQPSADGGTDTGPTPVELLVTSLASCVAHYAHRYLTRHCIDAAGLAVDADFTMATDRPARIASMTITLTPPTALPAERYDAFLAVASHCTVHNTLEHPPGLTIGLRTEAAERAA
ncbi:MAG TPA: OsmC family protein [Mycobacteriales bacterium]|nr:OsmC family protein [Mycobacteriales bacterium]